MGFKINTIHGDLFTATSSLAHCVGADFRMGMGIAVKFRDLFGQVEFLKKQNVSFFFQMNKFNAKINKLLLFFFRYKEWLCCYYS